MFAQYDGEKPEKIDTDVDGRLGWWRDTRFAIETPRFIMGGVALNFVEWANGPGAGKGRDWKNPKGHYAIAQLSPWVLWPPDGLNLKQGTNGELFGYGYLSTPLTTAKRTTARQDVPTGNQCWTLFLNTGNFKGPVTFIVPHFWSKPRVDKPELGGLFLDIRPPDPNKAVPMETQHIPANIARDAKGGPTPASPPPSSRRKPSATPRSSTASPRTTGRRCGTASGDGSTAGGRGPVPSTRRHQSSRPSRAAGRRGRSTRRTPSTTTGRRSRGVCSPPQPPWMRRPTGIVGARP